MNLLVYAVSTLCRRGERDAYAVARVRTYVRTYVRARGLNNIRITGCRGDATLSLLG